MRTRCIEDSPVSDQGRLNKADQFIDPAGKPMPLVSVVIPVYNRQDTILASVESVLRQTFTDFELIVVDDCSDDKTVQLLSSVEDSRLSVITHLSNQGAGAARNTGIRAAKGKYVAFHDSDDEWLPLKLEKQLVALDEQGRGTIGAYCAMILIQDSSPAPNRLVSFRCIPGNTRVSLSGCMRPSLLRGGSLISTQTLLVDRKTILEVGGFDESLRALEDWDCCLRLAEKGQFAFVNEPLVIQRFSPNSITRSAENRVKAHTRILSKLAHAVSDSPDIGAYQYKIVAGGWRRIGAYREAQRYYLKALRCRPFRAGAWFGIVSSSFLLIARLVGFGCGRRSSASPIEDFKKGNE